MPTASKTVRAYALGRALVAPKAVGIKHASVSVGTSPVELTAGLANRTKLFVRVVANANEIWIGDSGVSVGNGYSLTSQEELWLDVGPDIEIHAITQTGQSDVRVLETAQGHFSPPVAGQGTLSKILNVDSRGNAAISETGSSLKHAKITVSGEDNANKVELTAGLASRRSIYIKLMREDELGQTFIHVGGSDVEPRTSDDAGIPVWPRYELVLPVAPTIEADDPAADPGLYAIKVVDGDDADVRLLEIG